MVQFDIDAYIRKLAGVLYKGTLMLSQGKGTPMQYWNFVNNQVNIARRTLGTPLEWAQAIPDDGETPADYAQLEALDPGEAPEEFDL